MLVGAPKANNSFINKVNSKDKHSGTVFKCNVTSPSLDCNEQVAFDIAGKFFSYIFLWINLWKRVDFNNTALPFVYIER